MSEDASRELLLLKRKTFLCAAVVLLLAIAGAVTFMVLGVRSAEIAAGSNFEMRANELALSIESTWKDYEHATLSIHNYCRRERNTTRKEFRELYEYLLAGGLEFESAQCSPNVTHAERPAYEEEARLFYKENYPSINYTGIIGFVPDNVTGELMVLPSPERPFYFPVHYLEPVLPNAPAIELDMYSFPSQKIEIDLAVSSRQPVLSKRLHVVQETQEDAYSVIIYHPGIRLDGESDDPTRELSLVLVRIPSLLQRVAELQEESLAVYLYDTTIVNTNGTAEFLGAGAFTIIPGAGLNGGTLHQLALLPETDLAAVRHKYSTWRMYEKEVDITPSGTWVVVVVPIDGSYDPFITYVMFGGFMILAAGLFVAAWYYTNAQRDARLNALRVAAETERAALIVKNAENAAQAERELK